LRALAALAEGAVCGARRAVGASLGVATRFGIGAARDRSDADAGAKVIGARDAQLTSALEG
jgi:hypothetical protein